jgi:hypothetical protein
VSGRAAVRDFWNGVVEGLLAEASVTATDAGYIKATEEHRDVKTVLRVDVGRRAPACGAHFGEQTVQGHHTLTPSITSLGAFWVGGNRPRTGRRWQGRAERLTCSSLAAYSV